MEERKTIPENGSQVVTHDPLGSTAGMMVAAKHMECRRPGAKGTVRGWVPGHGGDVWWVEHEDGTVGAYCFDELEFTPEEKAVRDVMES